MAFWCRIKQSKLKSLSNQFKRSYFQIPGLCSVNHTVEYTRIRVLDKPYWVVHNNQIQFYNNVRFFAAPVQFIAKQEEKDTDGPRLNEQIKEEFVRLVTDEGHGIVSRREALERAKRLKLDLVEVQRTTKPPVCKLMDYHKERYIKRVKEKDRAKSKSGVTLRTDCKEVRFTGKIEKKDLKMKADMVKRLTERGYRVKCTAIGNPAMGKEDEEDLEKKKKNEEELKALLSRLSPLIEDFSIVESEPLVQKRQAYMVVRHVKFGPSKKGSGKKASKAGVTSNEVEESNQSPLQLEGNLDPADSDLESEYDYDSEQTEASISPSLEMPDKNPVKNKSTWSVLDDAGDGFDEVFDCSGDKNSVVRSSTNKQIKTAPEITFSPANIVRDSIRPNQRTRPELDSTTTDGVPSSPFEAPQGAENRYKSGPRNRYPPRTPMDFRGPGVRDSARLDPQLSNHQPRQPKFDLNIPSPTREPKRVETDASFFRNLKSPADEIPKREASHPSAPSSPSSYGLFSSPKANDTPRQQGVPAEVNRYKGGNPFGSSARNRSS